MLKSDRQKRHAPSVKQFDKLQFERFPIVWFQPIKEEK